MCLRHCVGGPRRRVGGLGGGSWPPAVLRPLEVVHLLLPGVAQRVERLAHPLEGVVRQPRLVLVRVHDLRGSVVRLLDVLWRGVVRELEHRIQVGRLDDAPRGRGHL
eukprot:scaffold72537_cov57-Phaeocystis_antarctica.AAC.2